MPPTHRPDVQLKQLRDKATEKGWKKPLMKLLCYTVYVHLLISGLDHREGGSRREH
jgi:hypothetical protein